MKRASLLAIILIAVILVSMAGCTSLKDKIGEKIGEGLVEKAIGGNVDISEDGVKFENSEGSFESGEDLKWPRKDMGDLPEPKAKITMVLRVTDGEGCNIEFGEMSPKDAKAYVEKLKTLGYENGMDIADDESINFSGQKATALVTFAYDVSSKEGSISYSIQPDQDAGSPADTPEAQ